LKIVKWKLEIGRMDGGVCHRFPNFQFSFFNLCKGTEMRPEKTSPLLRHCTQMPGAASSAPA
jgi:hypothetical protein